MSKADRIKDEIGWLKVLFAALAAADASLVAWLVQNYESATRVIAIVTGCSVAVITAIIIGVVVALYRCLKILEAL